MTRSSTVSSQWNTGEYRPGEYRSGEYLNEARISEKTGIGRTPVHQALDRLTMDGMVEVIPRKGLTVEPVSLDEVRHVVEARPVNETYCARLAWRPNARPTTTQAHSSASRRWSRRRSARGTPFP